MNSGSGLTACKVPAPRKPELGKALSTTIRFDKNHRFRPALCMKIGARAIAPSFGMTLMQKASTTDTVFTDTLNELTAMG
jgi:hypothetical protein